MHDMNELFQRWQALAENGWVVSIGIAPLNGGLQYNSTCMSVYPPFVGPKDTFQAESLSTVFAMVESWIQKQEEREENSYG